MDLRFIIYIIFGVLPSLTWLFYYLRKDVHPESNGNVIKIFLLGAFVTLPVFFIQIGLNSLLEKIAMPALLSSLLYWFLVIALTEELFKFLVVKLKVIGSSELDEPLDIMLYMVISALGFAALENILYLFSPLDGISFADLINRTLMISFIRFIGATFLHTLCAGTIGYFLALGICKSQKRYLFTGFSIAVLLHGLYNFSIMTLEGVLKIAVPVAILILLAYFVITGFEKLKKLKSVCKIKIWQNN